MEERGSPDVAPTLLSGAALDAGECEATLTVEDVVAVLVWVKLGRAMEGAVGVGLSKADFIAGRLDEVGSRGSGDFVGLDGELFMGAMVPRVVSHERSSAPAGGGLKVRAEVDDVNLVGDWEGVMLDCLSGEPPGVAARIVEGERPDGDSGRRKGDARPLPLNKGAGLMGDDGFDW